MSVVNGPESVVAAAVAVAVAGVHPGTDDEEAWRLGWSEKKGKQPSTAVPSEQQDGDGDSPPRWPKPLAAAANLLTLLPSPVFGAAVPTAPAAASDAPSPPPAVKSPSLGGQQQQVVPRKPGGPPMRVYLFMDDESAGKVQQVLGCLSEAASVLVITQDLTASQVVVATTSKLRSSPKMKSVVRKLGVPIYTIRSTSSSSIYRDLCPLLGLNPLTANPAAAGKATASSYDSSGDDDGEERSGAKPAGVRIA